MAPKPFEDARAVAAAVGVVALVAGITIAGLPESVPNDIAMTDVAASPTSFVGADDLSVARTPRRPASPSSSTVRDGRTTDARRPATTEMARTTVPTTVATPPSSSGPVLASEAQLRVVVANAGGANGLAARYTEIVVGFGYASVEPANATDRRDESVVYWSPGREAEARRLAEQLGVPNVEPIPAEGFVLGSFVADLWAMIGLDLEDR